MVATTSEDARYRVRFSNGACESHADTTPEKGGGGNGFRPHELLEAALGCCLNMHVRLYADNHGIPLGNVTTTVAVDRTDPSLSVFTYSISFSPRLAAEQAAKLLQVAGSCPVSRTLTRQIVLQPRAPVPAGVPSTPR